MEEKKSMTIEELAVLMQAEFQALRGEIKVVDKKVDLLETRMEGQFEELKERTFEPEEKESIVAAIETFNRQLEESALGNNDITLTRSEYDATAIAVDFPNRFTSPAEAFAE